MTAIASAEQILQAMPEGGLFADKNWLASPEPFPLSPATVREIAGLGHRLRVFLRACNSFYYRSRKRRLPPWIAATLDAGKPADLLDAAAAPSLREELPGVIRPDLILTADGFSLTEIDSVPGGIGLTGWLGETYARLRPDRPLVGGATGMIDGFRSLFRDGADIAISAEAAGYRPEMEWLAERAGGFEVHAAEDYRPRGRDIYRFFELFDHAAIPGLPEMQRAAAAGELRISAPVKPWLEEKLWLALFWNRTLRELWRRELRENQRDALAKITPFGWVVDPTPLPHHAVLPRLDVHSWQELAENSQRDRHLVLKLSGFNEDAWGSRSVVVGHDVSQREWAAAIGHAVESFGVNPWVLQEFRAAAIVEHPYFDRNTGALRIMQGRARLCPYYFVSHDGHLSLGGVLATIVPADKKILHGMSDAIMVPCCVAEE